MLRRIGAHVRNQWMGALALFVALGGTAVAATGALDGPAPGQDSVGSLDIIDGQVQSTDLRNNAVVGSKVRDDSLTDTDIAQNTLGFRETATSASDEIKFGSIDEWDVADNSLAGADVANNSLAGADVADNSLTGADIADNSGVDSCLGSVRLGSLCARAENSTRTWDEAFIHCANLGMRVPTLGEARQLLQTYDIPNVGPSEWFWTDELSVTENSGNGNLDEIGYTARENGGVSPAYPYIPWETVCVSTPTN